MRPGTPGFEPARLKAAREERGLTPLILAELVGVKRQTIYQYEGGESTPHPEVLQRLSRVLAVRPGFFSLPPIAEAETVFFRSAASATARARARCGRKAEKVAALWAELNKRLELPSATLPVSDYGDPLGFDEDEIEDAAQSTRRFWGLGDGPIQNMAWLLENHGAVLSRTDVDDKSMDSWSRWEEHDRNPIVLLNSFKASAVRSRFDAAHELGHLILHRGFGDGYWAQPEDGFRIRERQAHLFASAFLLPSEQFSKEVKVPSLERFLALKPRWLVSIQAMVRRSASLGLIDEAREQDMWRRISMQRWRTREPLDESIPYEEPRLLRRAFEVLRKHDPDGPAAVTLALELEPSDVANLANVEIDHFEAKDVISFRPR